MHDVVTTVPPDIAVLGAVPDRGGLHVHVIDRRASGALRLLLRLIKEARRRDVLLLNGSGRLDQVAAAAIRRSGGRSKLVISDATWARGGNLVDRVVCRLGIRAIDGPKVTYCVLSTAELETFPANWAVSPSRVAYTPFCHTLSPAVLAAPLQEGHGVFAGGDSMRDYGPLLRAAGELDTSVALAVRDPKRLPSLPPNVRAERVPHLRFLTLMQEARIVVVPLQPGIGRSAGQQTYLNGMALGKVVVVTDSPGARDYVTHEVDGLIVPPGDAGALAEVISWAEDARNAEAVRALRARAVRTARERFTPERHFEALLDVVAQVVGAPEVQRVA
jgi:glycosyltransferase involved in cell wall biosynthesis